MAEEKDDWLDDLEDSAEKESDLGQSDIDALFSGSDDLSPPASEEEDLGQADIDALLSGDDLAPTDSPQDEGSSSGILDQSDIETLLSSPDSSAQDQPFFDPDQDEIDKLFSEPDLAGVAGSQSTPVDDFDFVGTFDSGESASSQPTISPDFDDHEFKLEADIPDIPDFSDSVGGWDETKSFLDEETVVIPDEPTLSAVSAATSAEETASSTLNQPKWRKLLANRKLLFSLGGGGAVLLLVVAGFFFFKGGEGEPDKSVVPEIPTKVVQEQVVEAETPTPEVPPPPVAEKVPQEPSAPEAPVVAGGIPTLSDLALVMPAGSSELLIILEGKDPENHPLEYEFQSMPEHGQISGQAPQLVYHARQDFSGVDSFTVRATNGQHFSPIAKVTISRERPLAIPEPPVSTVLAEEVAPQAPPPPPTEAVPMITQERISARNVSYTISKSLVVPWKKIWRKSNSQPYNNDVGVDIIQRPRHGTLSAVKGRPSVYTPDPSFNGNDIIRYRFTLGELRSEAKTVTISVKHKNMSPELHIAPYSAVYNPGDTVILNASQTKDDNRDTLQFRWEQISGVPVVIKSLNSEGSQIAFVAPSTFSTVSDPGVVLMVTATDEKGWSVSRELQIKTQSRRNTAIWR